MEKYKIDIGVDFNTKLGGRFKKISLFSGESFYDDLLDVKYKDAVREGEKLHIYLDGASPYGSSFVDQSFGKLGRTYGASEVKKVVVFHSELYQWIIDRIMDVLWE